MPTVATAARWLIRRRASHNVARTIGGQIR